MPSGLSQRAQRTIPVSLVSLGLCQPASNQDRVGADPNLTESSQMYESLSRLTAQAGIIFSGIVLPADSLPTRIVRLRVLQSIRGVRAGEVFAFAQWPGADHVSLTPNERVIIFLHQPNAAGISSSVFGVFGVLRMGGGDLVNVSPLETLALRTAANRLPSVDNGPELDRLPGRPQLHRPFSRIPENEMLATIRSIVAMQDAGGDNQFRHLDAADAP